MNRQGERRKHVVRMCRTSINFNKTSFRALKLGVCMATTAARLAELSFQNFIVSKGRYRSAMVPHMFEAIASHEFAVRALDEAVVIE